MPTIREHIEAIVNSLAIPGDPGTPAPSFSYTKEQEENSIAAYTDYTNSHITLREIEEGGITVVNNGHKDDFILTLQFLKKADPDFTAVQHDAIIEAMRTVVSKFISKYNKYRVNHMQVFEEIERVKLVSITNEYDESLSGLEAQFTARLIMPRGVCI